MFDLDTFPGLNIIASRHGNAKIEMVSSHIYNLVENDTILDNFNAQTNTALKMSYSSYDISYGSVFIYGLGLGYLPTWIASKDSVLSVTVVEPSKNAIELFLMNNKASDKLTIICGDMNSFYTERHYDCLINNDGLFYQADDIVNSFKKLTNIVPNHDTAWFFLLEQLVGENKFNIDKHLDRCVGLENCCCMQSNISYKINREEKDFAASFKEIKLNYLNQFKIPNVTNDQINDYLYTFYNRLGYRSVINKNITQTYF